MPMARVAVPRPPVTRASPCLPVLMRACVAPSVTPSRNRSISSRVTAATFNEPKSGLMCLSMRASSPASVRGFLAVWRRVKTRPARQPQDKRSQSSATVAACARLLLRSPPDRRPSATSPRSRRASARAKSGVHGEPCRPMVTQRCRPSAVRYLTTYATASPFWRRAPKPVTAPFPSSQTVELAGSHATVLSVIMMSRCLLA